MSNINKGNQKLTWDFRHPAKAREFNELLRDIVPAGIYEGGAVTIASAPLSTMQIAPFTAFVKADSLYCVRVRTQDPIILSVGTAAPYITMKLNWQDVTENWAEFTMKDQSSITSTDIVFGKVTFSGATPVNVDYSEKTWGMTHNDGIFRVTNSTQSTSTTTGSIITYGGVGIGKNLYVGGSISGVGLGLRVYDNLISTSAIELGYYGTGARNAFIDFHNADSPSDYTARIIHPSGQTYLNYHNQVGTHYFSSGTDPNSIRVSGGMIVGYDEAAIDTSGIIFCSGNGSTARSGRTWLLDIANNAFRVVDATGEVARAEFIAGGTLNINSTVTVGSNLILTDSQVFTSAGGSNLHLDSSEGGSAVYLNWFGGSNGTVFGNGNAGQVAHMTGDGNLYLNKSLYVSTDNTTGGGIVLADDGDIVDLNTGYCAMRFSNGIQIYSGNKGGTPVITLGSNGQLNASSTTGSSSTTTGALVVSGGVGVAENIYVGGVISAQSGTFANYLRARQIIPHGDVAAASIDLTASLWNAGVDYNVYYSLWDGVIGGNLSLVSDKIFKLGSLGQYTSYSGSPQSAPAYTKFFLKGKFNIQVKRTGGSSAYLHYLVSVANGDNPATVRYSAAGSLDQSQYIQAFSLNTNIFSYTADFNGWYALVHDEPSSQGGCALQVRISLIDYEPEIQALT